MDQQETADPRLKNTILETLTLCACKESTTKLNVANKFAWKENYGGSSLTAFFATK
jgi:hypothetical protein